MRCKIKFLKNQELEFNVINNVKIFLYIMNISIFYKDILYFISKSKISSEWDQNLLI